MDFRRLLYACFAVVLLALLASNGLPSQVLHAGRVHQLLSVGLGCVPCAALVIGIRRRVPAVRLLAGVVASSAAFAAVVLVSISYLNWILDSSAPRTCSAVVTWRGWLGEKGPSRFALKVSRTPFVSTETLVYVDWRHHFALGIGAPVVVTSHAGALGDEWCADRGEGCVDSPDP